MKCLSNANEYIEECSNASNENECIMETNQKCGWNEGT